jgi:hypothetical protein
MRTGKISLPHPGLISSVVFIVKSHHSLFLLFGGYVLSKRATSFFIIYCYCLSLIEHAPCQQINIFRFNWLY